MSTEHVRANIDRPPRKQLANAYRTLDCRDGRHSACATCNCECHT